MSYFLVFDVESVGLYGEGFAFGAVVIDETGFICDELLAACHISAADGRPYHNDEPDRKWLEENLPPFPVGFSTPRQVRRRFRRFWQFWRKQGATMWADCAWPVEAKFLLDISDDEDMADAPYPLYDIAPLAAVCGTVPTATLARMDDELPMHNPLCDARQSARLLVAYLKKLPGPHVFGPLG